MNRLYIPLSALLLLATPSHASSAQANEGIVDCHNKITKFMDDASPIDSNKICLNQSRNKIIETEISDKLHNYIYAENSINMNANINVLKKIERTKTTLIIDGICSGDCSRLLAPLADRIILKERAFIALTDSSIPSRYAFFGAKIHESIFLEKGMTLNEMKALSEKYTIEKNEKFVEEVRLIANTHVNLSHLQWHSQVRQTLKHTQSNCWPVKSLIIILTPSYLKENGFNISGDKTPPVKSEILNIIEPLYESPISLYSYDQTPLEACR